MTEEKKSKVGVDTKYKPEYDDLAYKFCLLGATDKKLAEFFDVCEATINNWKHMFPSFLESIKKGKVVADGEVANSLFKRATGYVHPETKIATHEGQITDTLDVEKHYAPDPTAAIFWLKNRQPDQWRDKQEVDHTLQVNKADDSEW
ncbi:terminase small subunit [Vibrio phage ValSw3-3]|nr:terminase small subunit [Vibrio phage ValSw3-3]